MKLVSLIVLLPFYVWGMEGAPDSDVVGDSIQEVAPGVYAGQAKVGQEIVYFGMEKVDRDNMDRWMNYRWDAYHLGGNRNGGLLYELAEASVRGKRPPFDRKLEELTGFTEQEYSVYMDKLESVVEKNPRVVAALQGIGSGTGGFQINAEGNVYVAYASKRPVTGRFPLPPGMERTLKNFYHHFSNLLMVVRSVDHPDTNIYDNRGIFKNPISFIEDGNKYPGLSMKLHGFSAAVAAKFFRGKEYMAVSPIPAMAAIIVSTPGWQRGDVAIGDDMTTRGKDLLDHNPEETETIKTGKRERKFSIKIEALLRLYRSN